MKVPLLDLKQQYRQIKEDVLAVTRDIYDSQYFILGPHVERLEHHIAAYCQCNHALGVSSGSDALIIALMAAGVKAGDAVITTPYTFFATAGAIVRLGARPLFVDIEPDSYNLSPQRLRQCVEALSDEEQRKVKAIIPVHLYGQCCDMQPILDLAAQYRLTVIEDAAQAIGAEYRGRRAGSMGAYGCFSFFPSKNLGAFGDGGIVTVQNETDHQKLKVLRNHGAEPKYYHHLVGGNFRLDALQAAIVDVKLTHLDTWTNMRQTNAARYHQLFTEAGLNEAVTLPQTTQNRHIYNQFVIRVQTRRDELRQYLTAAGVGTEIYYPVPLHLQACFADLGYRQGDFPVSEAAARQTLALPIYPELTVSQQTFVVDCIRAFIEG